MDTTAACAHIETHGYCLIEGLLDGSEADRLADASADDVDDYRLYRRQRRHTYGTGEPPIRQATRIG